MFKLRESGCGVKPGDVIENRKVLGWQFKIGRQFRVVVECLACNRIAVLVVAKFSLRRQCNSCIKRTHGDYGSPEHMTWGNMKARCSNPKNKRYDRYGGRGIKVCERWDVYENFLADMGRKPTPEHSIDRIDNNGDYEPANCQWATRHTQALNRQTTRWLTYSEKTKTMKWWSQETGVPYKVLWSRIVKLGWPVEKSLETPIRIRKDNT